MNTHLSKHPLVRSLRLLCLPAVAAVTLGLASCDNTPKPDGKPALEFPEPVQDFGELILGEETTLQFPVRNVADHRVTITRVETGCGCTVIEEELKNLGPGEESQLPVLYQSGSDYGDYERTVKLYTDDPDQELYEISFKGFIYAPTRWEKQVLDMGEVLSKEGAEFFVSVYSTESDRPPISGGRMEDPRLEFALVETKPFSDEKGEGEEYVFRIAVPPGAELGRIACQARPITPQATFIYPAIHLKGEIIGDVVFEPKRVFSRMEPNSEAIERVTLKSRSGTPFEVLEINAPGVLDAEYSVEEGATPDEKILVARLKSAGTGGEKEDLEIKIQTDGSEEVMTLQIPVITLIQRAN